MAPLFRRLPMAAAVASVLWVVAAVAAVVAAANSVLPVVRMRPIDISGTYTTTYASDAGGGCPTNFTIGQGEPFSRADSLSPRAPSHELARNFLGSAVSEEGVSCSGGALVAVSSLQTFNIDVMNGVGKPNGSALLHSSVFSERMLHWSDVVGLGVASISCGASAAAAVPRWGPDTWVAIGEMQWSARRTTPDGKIQTVAFGGSNRTAIFLTSKTIWCVMAAPPRRELVIQPPVEDGNEDGKDGDAVSTPVRAGEDGGNVSTGAAVGIGVAAAAAGLALGAAVGLFTARWHHRRRPSNMLVSHQASAAGEAVGKSGAAVGLAGRPSSRPPLPRAGKALPPPNHPVVGLALPTFGEQTGVPPAAAAAAEVKAAKDLRVAFGLADAPPMPPELSDSMAPPPMPDALRGSTISDPSSAARSGRS